MQDGVRDGVRKISCGRVLLGIVGMIGMVAAAGRAAAYDPAEHYGIPQVKYINEQVAKGWDESRLLPSPAATMPIMPIMPTTPSSPRPQEILRTPSRMAPSRITARPPDGLWMILSATGSENEFRWAKGYGIRPVTAVRKRPV